MMSFRIYQLCVGISACVCKLGMDLFTTFTGEPLWRIPVLIAKALHSWSCS
jgi:hypothetical protein